MNRVSIQLRIAAICFAAGALIMIGTLLRGSGGSAAQPTQTAARSTTERAATARILPSAAPQVEPTIAAPTAQIRAGVAPKDKDTCPVDYPIKGNQQSKLYHEPGDRGYAATDPEVCFATAADARAAGYDRPKNP